MYINYKFNTESSKRDLFKSRLFSKQDKKIIDLLTL